MLPRGVELSISIYLYTCLSIYLPIFITIEGAAEGQKEKKKKAANH